MNQNGNNVFSLICIFILLTTLLTDISRPSRRLGPYTKLFNSNHNPDHLLVSIKLHILILVQIFSLGVDSLIPSLDFLPSLNYLLRK